MTPPGSSGHISVPSLSNGIPSESKVVNGIILTPQQVTINARKKLADNWKKLNIADLRKSMRLEFIKANELHIFLAGKEMAESYKIWGHELPFFSKSFEGRIGPEAFKRLKYAYDYICSMDFRFGKYVAALEFKFNDLDEAKKFTPVYLAKSPSELRDFIMSVFRDTPAITSGFIKPVVWSGETYNIVKGAAGFHFHVEFNPDVVSEIELERYMQYLKLENSLTHLVNGKMDFVFFSESKLNSLKIKKENTYNIELKSKGSVRKVSKHRYELRELLEAGDVFLQKIADDLLLTSQERILKKTANISRLIKKIEKTSQIDEVIAAVRAQFKEAKILEDCYLRYKELDVAKAKNFLLSNYDNASFNNAKKYLVRDLTIDEIIERYYFRFPENFVTDLDIYKNASFDSDELALLQKVEAALLEMTSVSIEAILKKNNHVSQKIIPFLLRNIQNSKIFEVVKKNPIRLKSLSHIKYLLELSRTDTRFLELLHDSSSRGLINPEIDYIPNDDARLKFYNELREYFNDFIFTDQNTKLPFDNRELAIDIEHLVTKNPQYWYLQKLNDEKFVKGNPIYYLDLIVNKKILNIDFPPGSYHHPQDMNFFYLLKYLVEENKLADADASRYIKRLFSSPTRGMHISDTSYLKELILKLIEKYADLFDINDVPDSFPIKKEMETKWKRKNGEKALEARQNNQIQEHESPIIANDNKTKQRKSIIKKLLQCFKFGDK